MIDFTVFIPVFNGEDVLKRLSQNLKAIGWFGRQDIEILIVNDGSTDKSMELIQEYFDFNNVTVKSHGYNRHKMTIFLEAIAMARGRRFLTLDCDDEIYSDSLTQILQYESIYGLSEKNCAGIIGNVENQNGELVGSEFPINGLRASSFECYYIHGVKGEKWGFTYTSLLRDTIRSEIKIIEGLYTPESVVWLAVSSNKPYFYVNDIWRVYHIDERDNSIMSISKRARNYYGIKMHNRALLKHHISGLLKLPNLFLRVLVMYTVSSILLWAKRG